MENNEEITKNPTLSCMCDSSSSIASNPGAVTGAQHAPPGPECVANVPLMRRARSLPLPRQSPRDGEVVSNDGSVVCPNCAGRDSTSAPINLTLRNSIPSSGNSSARPNNTPNNQQTEGVGTENPPTAAAPPPPQERNENVTMGPPSPLQRIQPDPMPYVYAEGANGRRVYGFVYRYTEPGFKILCVCHGIFLTPAQFVQHAGGGVVENPLRHIIVTRFPYSMN